MKTTYCFAAALLGLSLSFSAHAQTPVVGAPGAMSTPGTLTTPGVSTGTVVPGQTGNTMPGTGVGPVIGSGAVQPNVTTPMGTSGMSPTGVPAGSVDGGTLRSNQPMGSPGSQSTRRLNSRSTRATTTTRP